MSISIKEIIQTQLEFDKSLKKDFSFINEDNQININNLEHLIVCLVGEIGEFSNIVKKLKRGDAYLEKEKSNLEEELSDIFIYYIKIVTHLGIDLEDIYFKKLELNKERFKQYKK